MIFLDIDGVVHSLYGQDLFKESCCALLEDIVRGTGASIVLSSTWRTQARSTAMVNALLKQRRLQGIIDRTRDLSAEMQRHVPREVEICEWVDRHPEVVRWIAIDDMDLQSDDTECAHRMRGHFVHTSSSTGLVPVDAELAMRLMSAQRNRQRPATAERPNSASFATPRRRPVGPGEKAPPQVANAPDRRRSERERHVTRHTVGGAGDRERYRHALKA